MPVRKGHSKWRILLLGFALAAATTGLIGRLAYLQIVRHEAYAAAARDEHFGRDVVYAQRGALLDRNGYPLATSVYTFDVYVARAAWEDSALALQAAEQLASILGRPAAEIYSAPGSGDGDYLLARNVPYEKGRQIQEQGVRGVKLVRTHQRVYPEGDIAATLLGFLGRDEVGLTGIEKDWNETLMGEPGVVFYERDTFGRPIAFGERKAIPPKPGPDVVLTIDRNIQRMAEQHLDRAIEARNAAGGDVIVMNPHTGEVLAMASRPAFQFTTLNLNDPKQMDLYRPRAITDLYEPGSIMKVITMAAGVDLGIISPGTTYQDEGYVQVGGWTIRNWDHSANGTQTMTNVLVRSLNTGSIWAAQHIGQEKFYQYVTAFGFGSPTGIDVSGEAAGLIRTPDDPNWSESDLAANSFGQGITATPLQVVTAISALANGGTLMQPYVVREIVGPDGAHATAPKAVRRVVSEETAATLRRMMQHVVEDVPGHRAQVAGYSVGGKSGTSSVLSEKGTYTEDGDTISSFVAFAPVDDPAVVVYVKVDRPDGWFGISAAAPAAGDLLQDVLNYLKVPPDTQFVREAAP